MKSHFENDFDNCHGRWERSRMLWNLTQNGLDVYDIQILLPSIRPNSIRGNVEVYGRFKDVYETLNCPTFPQLLVALEWEDAEYWVHIASNNSWSSRRMVEERNKAMTPPSAVKDITGTFKVSRPNLQDITLEHATEVTLPSGRKVWLFERSGDVWGHTTGLPIRTSYGVSGL